MKTRSKVTCQGTNGRSVWLQWITDQFRRHDCTRETRVSIEYADTDDPGLEPKPNRDALLKAVEEARRCADPFTGMIKPDTMIGQREPEANKPVVPVVYKPSATDGSVTITTVRSDAEPRPLLTASVEMPRKRGE